MVQRALMVQDERSRLRYISAGDLSLYR